MLCEFNRVISYVSFTYSENSNRFIYIDIFTPKLPACCLQKRKKREVGFNCFKGDVGKTSERRGGAHVGFSERIDTIFNITERNWIQGATELWQMDHNNTEVMTLVASLAAVALLLFFCFLCAGRAYLVSNRHEMHLELLSSIQL